MPPLIAILALLALASTSQTRWKRLDGPTVGPIQSLAVSPAQPGWVFASVRTFAPYPIYVGAELAWSRRGARWVARWSNAYPQILDVEADPSSPGVLWGADYDKILKSLDAGQTWITALDPDNPVESVAVDRSDPDRVYALGQPDHPGDDFNRTVDGGRSWSHPFHFFLPGEDVAVVHDVVPGAVLRAGGQGIYRSTDLGDTFTSVLSGYGVPKLAVGSGNPSVVWCLTADFAGSTGIQRSLDGARTFSPTTSPAVDLSAIAAHATDPNVACVGSIASGVFSTFDGGQTWIRGSGIPDTAYLRAIVADPTRPSDLYGAGYGSRGGVWFSADSGLHWRPASRGLASSIPKLRFDPTGRVYAIGLRVPIRRAGGAAWEVLDHPHGSTTRASDFTVDPRNPSTIAWINDIPNWSLGNEVWLSHDDGRTWEDYTPPVAHNYEFGIEVVRFDREGNLYAMTNNGHLFRREPGALAWGNADGPWNFPKDLVFDPNDASVLHLTDNTTYFRSMNGGRTWFDGASGLAGVFGFDGLTVNPLDTDEVYVLAYDGPWSRRLFRSADRGSSWAPAGSGLPAQDHLACLAVDPDSNGRLLVGTRDHGVFLSTDHGASFVPWSEGIADAPVFSVAFDPSRTSLAWVSSAGGGLWERALP